MPKPSVFPILINDLKSISVSFLREHGYLKLNQFRSGTITWSSNGNRTSSVSIRVNTEAENSYLELDYKCNEVPIKYRVQLISYRSNLGKGVVWFFICPHTSKRCRKLYLVNTYFYHRLAFKGCMYEKQIQSKKTRELDKTLGAYFRSDQLFEQLNKKHFKKHYRGKLTKRLIRITKLQTKLHNKEIFLKQYLK